MGTTARRFYPHSANWDGTDPASGDVRTMETALPAATSGSSCDFGTSGAKTITVDPYTAGRTTTGLASEFGWAVDIAGSDGMDGAANANRYIPAGTWLYQGTLFASPAIAIANCTVAMSVYRVAASPSTTRTLLFTDAGVSVPAVATTGTTFTRTTASQSEVELAPGETIQCTFTLTCTGQLGGLVIDFRTGDQTSDCWVDVPSPGVRTVHDVAVTVTAVGTASVVVGTKTVTGVVYDTAGAPASGVAVKLFRESDDVKISTFTTPADGRYTFTRADDDTTEWYCSAFSDDTHHGTTDRSLLAT